MDRITKNFSLSEFTSSQTAARENIENSPPQSAISNLEHLVKNLLQPLRDLYKATMRVNSGYRSPKLNSAVGGVATSQHLKGEAADIGCANPKKLLETLKNSSLQFDQAILYPTFLHLSLKKGANRGQIIIKMVLFLFFSLQSCSKPIYLQGKTEYIEKTELKDTTIYIEIEKESIKSIATDSSFLESLYAYSAAVVDSFGALHHSLVQKPMKLEKEIQYVEKCVTVYDSIPYPQIVTQIKEVETTPALYRWSFIILIAILAWKGALFFKKFV